ncbi:MAG: hypothetical protein U0414_32250 [Polyangiaceae bacterium]
MIGRGVVRSLCLAGLVAGAAFARVARAEDLSAIVAKAHDQIDSGNYADAMKTLGALKGKTLPPALAIEAALLETQAAIVTSGADAAATACTKAITAADYDPDVARDQSPKVRDACRAAAKTVRGGRLAAENIQVGEMELKDPEVAFQPVRLSTKLEKKPAWLKFVARISGSGLDGSFDLPLIPSDEGPLLGTLDPSWVRPKSKIKVELVAQDKFGDLGTVGAHDLNVPEAESLIEIDDVPSDAKVTLDDDDVKPDANGRFPAPPGNHEVELTLASGATASSKVEAKRGNITRVALSPQQPSPSRVLPWITTGTAVVLAGVGTVLLINAESRRSELVDAAAQREPGTGLPATEYADLQAIDDERSTFTTAGVGCLIAGGSTAILATILWLVPSGKSKPAPSEPPKAAFLPVVSPQFTGLVGVF